MTFIETLGSILITGGIIYFALNLIVALFFVLLYHSDDVASWFWAKYRVKEQIQIGKWIPQKRYWWVPFWSIIGPPSSKEDAKNCCDVHRKQAQKAKTERV